MTEAKVVRIGDKDSDLYTEATIDGGTVDIYQQVGDEHGVSGRYVYLTVADLERILKEAKAA